jgi:5-methylcytosine-specific restriction enzyme A
MDSSEAYQKTRKKAKNQGFPGDLIRQMCYKNSRMSIAADSFIVDPKHISRERAKARELRASQWWKQVLAKGTCHYCQEKFEKARLTMDHVVPVARGGRSTKGNVVVSCKECNNKKRWMTPAELLMQG